MEAVESGGDDSEKIIFTWTITKIFVLSDHQKYSEYPDLSN